MVGLEMKRFKMFTFGYTAGYHDSITLSDWTLSGIAVSDDYNFMTFGDSSKTKAFTIENITIAQTSTIKDSVMFNLKGEILNTLDINNIALYDSSFGVGSDDTRENIFLKLYSAYGTTGAITIDGVTAQNSMFQ